MNWLRRHDRSFAVLATIALALITTWWEFYGHNALQGTRGWWIFGDLYLMISGANQTGIHAFTHLYVPGTTGSLAPPGFIYGLAFLETIARSLDLTIPTMFGSHLSYGATSGAMSGTDFYDYLYGSGAVFLLPVLAVLAALPLLAANELIARIEHISRWQARCGLVLAGCLFFWMSAQWGHPDDAISMGILLWGAVKMVDGKPGAAGWLLGAAMAIQPVAGLAIPVLVALVPTRKIPGVVARIALLPLLAVLPQLLGDWKDAKIALFSQPDGGPFKTPLYRLATPLHFPHTHALVSSGHFRTVSVLASVALGVWVYWRTHTGQAYDAGTIVWLMSVALSFRMLVEPVMWPYYVAPALIVLCCTLGPVPAWRFVLASVLIVGAVVGASVQSVPWLYWLSFLVPMGLAVMLARPSACRRNPFSRGRVEQALL